MPEPSTTPPPFGNPKAGAGPSAPPGAPPAAAPSGDLTQEGEPGEVEVLITPRAAVLDELQVTEHEFEWALGRSLDLLEEAPDDEEPAALEDVEIILNGRTFRLEEVAEVEIGGDLSELGPLPDPAADDEEE